MKIHYHLSIIACIALISSGCCKEPDDNTVRVGPASFSLDKVTATTATFSGHADVSGYDIPYTDISIYYSDNEEFSLENAEKASLSSDDMDGYFVFTVKGLRYGTKYHYCIVTDVRDNINKSEVKEFTTDNAEIELNVSEETIVADFDPVVEFYGKITGFSEEDMENLDIGVMYSTDSENIANGQYAKVEVTEIIPGDRFYIKVEDLPIGARYCYCYFYGTENKYFTGEIKDFLIVNSYSAEADMDMSSATDLSASETANCYLVSEPGTYKFKAVKGNSDERLEDMEYCEILWESFGSDVAPEKRELIRGFRHEDGYIAFQTSETFKEGNAVIAARNGEGKILWSWHIWMTDTPQEQVYYNNAGTMMDRNLGATSATPGDAGALGLLYQWGRKDPFLGSSAVNKHEGVVAKSTITWPSPVERDINTGKVEYAVQNPTVFISVPYAGDWKNKTDYDLWQSDKTVYDPCPPGWRVPDGGRNGVWSKALGSTDARNFPCDPALPGLDFSGILGDSDSIWYPFADGHHFDGRPVLNVGYTGCCWSCTKESYGERSCHISFTYSGRVVPDNSTLRAYGLSVRCWKE